MAQDRAVQKARRETLTFGHELLPMSDEEADFERALLFLNNETTCCLL